MKNRTRFLYLLFLILGYNLGVFCFFCGFVRLEVLLVLLRELSSSPTPTVQPVVISKA